MVAEGVESTEQANVLRKLCCTVGQGFMWSPAVPATQALQLLQKMGRRDNQNHAGPVTVPAPAPVGGTVPGRPGRLVLY